MSYTNLIRALDELEALYESLCNQAERYAASKNANALFVDQRYNELQRFYAALAVLQKYNFDPFGDEIMRQLVMARLSGPDIHGVIIMADFRPVVVNRMKFHYKQYAETTN